MLAEKAGYKNAPEFFNEEGRGLGLYIGTALVRSLT
jgi:hypothetical protein